MILKEVYLLGEKLQKNKLFSSSHLTNFKITHSVSDLVGNTPLLKLKGPSELTKCEILGKAEFLNPGQSVKDRAALSIIKNAEKNNLINKNNLIVEGTAGNTGIGLTIIGLSLGYKTLIVMPNNQSLEKITFLRELGASLKLVPPKPYSDPKNFIRLSEKIAKKNNAFWANQFDNTANRDAHINGTAKEIWNQTKGKVDAFVSAIGTGGTIAGVSIGLKNKNPKIKIICADPFGSGMFSILKHNKICITGSSITEGIGQSRITENLKNAIIDDAIQIKDNEALKIIFSLLENEGLFLGPSSGINIAAAMQVAKDLGPGHTIVTILCDYGNKYSKKLFNKEFLYKHNLPIPKWLNEND